MQFASGTLEEIQTQADACASRGDRGEHFPAFASLRSAQASDYAVLRPTGAGVRLCQYRLKRPASPCLPKIRKVHPGKPGGYGQAGPWRNKKAAGASISPLSEIARLVITPSEASRCRPVSLGYAVSYLFAVEHRCKVDHGERKVLLIFIGADYPAEAGVNDQFKTVLSGKYNEIRLL